jgi:very-short-patch-repair endonuclease
MRHERALTGSDAPIPTHLPTRRVIRLAGLTDQQLAVALDPLPDGVPVTLRYDPAPDRHTAQDVVDDVLDRMEAVALDLFPTWLPGAEGITHGGDFDRRVARELAHRHAASSAHFGPFLADVAEAALTGGIPDRRQPREARAEGLTRIIADGYGRDGVILVIAPTDPADDDVRIALALEWLVSHAAIGVWLVPGALPGVDRYPTWSLAVPPYVGAMRPAAPTVARTLEYPPVAGMPHPASEAEQALERRLAQCDWAVGRRWNQVYASHSLAPPIRVDLMWPDERCAVEIDGPDHRGSLKYAADRRRDNGLVLDGYAVLRFTNDDIADDPVRVIADIERLLSRKRIDEGNLR